MGAGQNIDGVAQERGTHVRRGIAEDGVFDFGLDDAVIDRLQRRLGLLNGDAGLQAAEGIRPAPAPVIQSIPAGGDLRLHHHRDEDVRACGRVRFH